MEWWQELGVSLQFMPDTPALAYDMTVNGPKYAPFKHSLSYNMQNSDTSLNAYPPDGVTFPEGE